MPTTIRDVCQSALMEIGAIAQGESIADGDASFVLGKLNRLLDNWNAERAAIYAESRTAYALVPDLSPHTIGPAASTPTWTVAQGRPVDITSLSLILPTSIYVSIALRDEQWYDAQTMPGLTSDMPTDCFYSPGWPLGSLYFWPVPTAAYDVELVTRVVLADVALADTFTLPPGYHDAIVLTLAEGLCPSFGRPGNADLSEMARKARERVWRNNDVTPDLQTQDSGIPGGRRGGRFSYLTGRFIR